METVADKVYEHKQNEMRCRKIKQFKQIFLIINI